MWCIEERESILEECLCEYICFGYINTYSDVVTIQSGPVANRARTSGRKLLFVVMPEAAVTLVRL